MMKGRASQDARRRMQMLMYGVCVLLIVSGWAYSCYANNRNSKATPAVS